MILGREESEVKTAVVVMVAEAHRGHLMLWRIWCLRDPGPESRATPGFKLTRPGLVYHSLLFSPLASPRGSLALYRMLPVKQGLPAHTIW